MTASQISLDEIVSEFQELDDASERLAFLIEVGDSLPNFPEDQRVEANRVQGCQSNVWLIPRVSKSGLDDGTPRIEFLADSDAPMVRGLVSILLATYSGKTPREILAFPIEELFEKLRLRTFVSPLRSNGLHSMVQRVLSIARLASEHEAATDGGAYQSSLAQRDVPPVLDSQLDKPFSNLELTALRKDFPILAARTADGRDLVYLDNAASSQRPTQVVQAIVQAYESYYSNVHRGGHWLAAQTTEKFEAARVSVQRFLNAAGSQEIIFTSGTTAAINLVARSWGDSNLDPGDEILLTEMEHHSNIVPWQQLAQRTGAKVRFAPIDDEGELTIESFRGWLNQRTKLVAVTAVSNVLGTITPLAQIIRESHRAGAKVLVDAAQAVPHMKIDVQTLDADFVAFSGHKMLGPSGIGVLYGKERLLDSMPPFLGGGSMIRTVDWNSFESATLPYKFEAGTPPIVPAIGLGVAIEYLEKIGLERIHHHEQRLARLADSSLVDVPGLRIIGPKPEKKGGIVTFVIEGIHADDLSKVLDSRGIAIRAGHHCAMPLHSRLGISASARASFYFYNTPDEVEQLAAGVKLAVKLLGK